MSNEPKRPEPSPPATAPLAKKRLPYEPPAVISEEVFETLALSCANARFVCPYGGVQS